MTAYEVGRSRIRVEQGCLDLEGSGLIETMSVHHMTDLKAGALDLANSDQLVTCNVAILRDAVRVFEDAITPSLADIKRAAVPRIYQAINVIGDRLNHRI
jgi:hypothetical protein